MRIARKILRLDPEQSARLAGWLRTAAEAMQDRAAELTEVAKRHSLRTALLDSAARLYADAEHARQLAARLDPEFEATLARLEQWSRDRPRGKR